MEGGRERCAGLGRLPEPSLAGRGAKMRAHHVVRGHAPLIISSWPDATSCLASACPCAPASAYLRVVESGELIDVTSPSDERGVTPALDAVAAHPSIHAACHGAPHHLWKKACST